LVQMQDLSTYLVVSDETRREQWIPGGIREGERVADLLKRVWSRRWV